MNLYQNKPYIWDEPNRFPNKAIGDYNWRIHKTNRLDFIQGKELNLKNPDLILSVEISSEQLLKYDCLPNNFGSPLVNKKVLSILNKLCPEDFQVFDAEIRTKDGIETSYKILNIIRTIDSIDMKKSIYKLSPEGIPRNVQKLFFKKNCMGSYHMAREIYYHPLELVSKDLVQIFKKEKITGVRFLKDEELYDYTSPEEIIASYYKDLSDGSRRILISTLASRPRLEDLKESICRLPKESIVSLIPMFEDLVNQILIKSQLHKNECEELLEFLRAESR